MARKSKRHSAAAAGQIVGPAPLAPAVSERLIIAPILIASAAMLAWMARPLFLGQIPTTGDLFEFHYPVREFYAGCLARGQRFEWMPAMFGGFYLAGEGQVGAFHPLHWLLYRFLPLDTAFVVELVSAYPAMFAGAWLLLRRWCEPAPAALGAMLFTFSGYNLSHGWHMNLVAVVAHLPWLLLAIHVAFVSPSAWRRAGACGAIALLTGSQLLLGHPQAVWLCGLVEAAYALHFIVISPWPTRLRGGGVVVVGKLLGIACGAIQLLATWHAARGSLRASADDSFATSYSLPPQRLLELLHPYLFRDRIVGWSGDVGDEYTVYASAVPLLLAAWWLALVPRLRAESHIRHADRLGLGAAVLGGLGLWLATGSYGGLYYLQTWLPVVGQFRSPARYVLFAQLALAGIAAVAFVRLQQQTPPCRADHRRALWAPWSVAAASTIAAVLNWLLGGESTLEHGLALILGVALFIAAAGLLTAATRGWRWALPALALFAAADLALYGLAGVVAWQRIAPREEALRQLARENPLPPPGEGRIVRGEFSAAPLLFQRRMLDGYSALMPRRELYYLVLPALRVAQVEYVHFVFQEVAHVPDAEDVGDRWYRIPPPLPRARLVARSHVSLQPDVDLESLDVDRAALTTRELELSGGEAGTAKIVLDDPGHIRAEATSPGRQLLVVSESFDDGWVAEIDGQPVPVERINADFLGCVVPAGDHLVTFRFRPAHLATGAAISLTGLAIGLILAALLLQRSLANTAD